MRLAIAPRGAPAPMRGFLSSLSPLRIALAPLQSEWASELPPYEWHPFQGAITLNHQGSTFYTLLIVAGESPGRVVYVDTAGQPPYFVRNTDYLSWYEHGSMKLWRGGICFGLAWSRGKGRRDVGT